MATSNKISHRIIKAKSLGDVDSVSNIYELIHQQEESGIVSIGWKREIYPTRETALKAISKDSLFIMCIDDKVVASAIIDRHQPEGYSSVEWLYTADDNKVGVLHTLVVHPNFFGRGLGKEFVAFFETYCRDMGYEVVRMDTQVKNTRPFNLYPKLGYRLAAIKTVPFQGLPEKVKLAMFEKRL